MDKLGKRVLAVVLAAVLLGGGIGMLGIAPVAAAFVATPMISAEVEHTLALKQDGTVWAWGNNSFGQLGNGTRQRSTTPVKTLLLTNITMVAAGRFHSVALKSDGTVWTWGYNQDGELGYTTPGQFSETPQQVTSLSNITAIAAGSNHSIALKNDGTVWAWGVNSVGSLGDGTTTKKTTPVQVRDLTGVVSVVASDGHNLAIKNDDTIWAWGYSFFGQLGDGSTTNRTRPVQIALTNVKLISAGAKNSAAIKNDGTIWAWGLNSEGQVIGETAPAVPIPKHLTSLSDVDVIAAHHHFTILKKDGSVWTWGFNNVGQLGNGTTTNNPTPTPISTLSNIVEIAAGNSRSFAIRNDGSVWSWGYNGDGELGDGSTTNRTTPVQVKGEGGIGYFNVYDNATTTYTITYNANGGSVSPSSASVTANSATTLPNPTRLGYTCTGWFTAASSGTKIGNAGASYTPTTSITLYAQWEANAPSGGTLTLAELEKDFPAGMFWNRWNGSAFMGYDYSGNTVTSHPCPANHDSIDACNNYPSYGTGQCHGFALKLADKAYGLNAGDSRNWEQGTVDNLKPGDIWRGYLYGGNHSIFVTAVDGETITFADCNEDEQCGIRWRATTTKTRLKEVVNDRIYSAPYALTPNPPHTHTYNSQITTQPTCTTAGVTTYTCVDSDHSYTQNAPAALGHAFTVKQNTVDPTYDAQGYTVYKCSRCTATENRDFTAKLTPEKGIFGTNPRWSGEWWHYILFFLGGFVWMWF